MTTADGEPRRRRQQWGSVRQVKGGWQARLPPSVDPQRRPLEGGPFRSRKAAAVALRRAERAWEEGRTPDLDTAAVVRTVDHAVERYLDVRVPDRDAENLPLSRNTIRDYDHLRARVINHPVWGIGGKPLRGRGALMHSDVTRWANAVASSGPNARTRATKALRLLRAALQMAVRDHLLPANPAEGVVIAGRGRSQATKAHYLFTGPEMVAMGRAALDVSDHPLAVDIMLWGGVRSEEVRGLQARDLRARRMQIRVERAVVESYGISMETTKSTQTRFVRLPARLVAMLEADLAARGLTGDDLLFPRRSGRGPHLMYGYELINCSWAPARDAAGIAADPEAESPGRRTLPTPHDARATHASWLHALGWGDLEAMAQLGHSTITLTKNLYAEAQQTDREHDIDAARLARDPDLPPGRKLDLLWEAWAARWAGLPAPAWDAYLAGTSGAGE